jgi:N-methylhydantoinase A
MTASGLRVAADIGGTFTDIALIFPDGRLATRKLPSTPDDYARGVVEGIVQLIEGESLAPEAIGEVLHACTVATNAILEGKGARTALVTTAGFRDVLEMRRIRVPRLYEPLYRKPPQLVPRRLRFEVAERLDARGEVVLPLDLASVDAVIEALRAAEVEAIAVCLLHSYANPSHELAIGEKLRAAFPGMFISLSCEILPEIREYERTSTTVINSLVGPPVRAYLQSLVEMLALKRLPARVLMMQSAGGVVDVRTVMKLPAQIVECGPAAGVIGARHVGAQAGYGNVISFDMGGTTAKASLIEHGALVRTDEYEVGGGISLSSRLVKGGGYALKLPVIDISEVGAGGGSIVWIDRGGSLKVGPHSAGAVPGPACYGRGGAEPTVTDANVVLGYLNPASLAGGTVPIERALSEKAITDKLAKPLGVGMMAAAWGIHEVVTTVMTRAVKTVTTYRGRDPRDFSIFAFGGNGGVHAVSLARSLGIGTVVLPPGAGVFSALGLLFADVEMNASASYLRDASVADPHDLEARYLKLERSLEIELDRPVAGIRHVRQADLRYFGQAFELTVAMTMPVSAAGIAAARAAFEAEHERTYGHRLEGKRVDIVTLRVTSAIDSGGPKALRRESAAISRAATGSRSAYFGPAAGSIDTPVIGRFDLDEAPRQGPFIVEEYEGTTVVPPDCAARRDAAGNIIITVSH